MASWYDFNLILMLLEPHSEQKMENKSGRYFEIRDNAAKVDSMVTWSDFRFEIWLENPVLKINCNFLAKP